MKRIVLGLVAMWAVCILPVSARAVDFVWIEGEDYTGTNFNRHGWYEGTSIRKDLLSPGLPEVLPSNGAWLAHYTSGSSTAWATYNFSISSAGTYTWWLRCNPFHNSNGGGVYKYSLDNAALQDVPVEDYQDLINLVSPGIDIRFIAWVRAGAFSLSAGSHTIKVQIGPGGLTGNETHGGIDAMCFAKAGWAPAGVLRPDEIPASPGPTDWFPLIMGPDDFSPDSIIDMSGLIEKPAGLHGRVQQSGEQFVLAQTGAPIRFWGCDAGMAATPELQQRQARFYAKHGIDLVRQHPVEDVLGSLKGPPGGRYFDPAALDRLDRWFSILKDQGVYMCWSIFYHHVVLSDEGVSAALYGELPSLGSGRDCYGKATFITEYQDSQWSYASLLMQHVNPYTGLAYKDDPALAIVECRNEDSVFFHNPLSDGLVHGTEAPNHKARLQAMWHAWVHATYANDAALAQAWGAGKRAGDSVDADPVTQPMYMYAAWEMQADGPAFNKSTEKARMGDFIRFLAQMQRGTYETYRQRLRGIGYQGVVVSTGWQAGGPAASSGNLWTDDGCDAIDRHDYFGGGAGGHQITTGSVNNGTHLSRPGSGILSSGLFQVEDKPYIMTEWTSSPPNQWKAEIAPLFAFYGMGLQGWDASMQFAGHRSAMGDGWPGMSSYVTETPHYIAQFPALAFAIYKGHIREGSLVSARRIAVADAFKGVENAVMASTPVEALAVGRVTAKVADGQEPPVQADMSPYWNAGAKVVNSATGQLTWDYKNQVVTLQTPKTQAVVGFAGGQSFDLPGVTVQMRSAFTSLIFTPLDDRPLIRSNNILITAMARDRQLSSEYSADGSQLLKTGGPPLYLEPVQATITVKGDAVAAVKVVDVYGVPTNREVACNGNTFDIDGRYATYYYQVVRSIPPAHVGDFDYDGDVDMEDFGHFQSCLSGAGVPQMNSNCFDCDFNSDSAVDGADLLVFEGCMCGPAVPAPDTCLR
jgi:hypothetical protein